MQSQTSENFSLFGCPSIQADLMLFFADVWYSFKSESSPSSSVKLVPTCLQPAQSSVPSFYPCALSLAWREKTNLKWTDHRDKIIFYLWILSGCNTEPISYKNEHPTFTWLWITLHGLSLKFQTSQLLRQLSQQFLASTYPLTIASTPSISFHICNSNSSHNGVQSLME